MNNEFNERYKIKSILLVKATSDQILVTETAKVVSVELTIRLVIACTSNILPKAAGVMEVAEVWRPQD